MVGYGLAVLGWSGRMPGLSGSDRAGSAMAAIMCGFVAGGADAIEEGDLSRGAIQSSRYVPRRRMRHSPLACFGNTVIAGQQNSVSCFEGIMATSSAEDHKAGRLALGDMKSPGKFPNYCYGFRPVIPGSSHNAKQSDAFIW